MSARSYYDERLPRRPPPSTANTFPHRVQAKQPSTRRFKRNAWSDGGSPASRTDAVLMLRSHKLTYAVTELEQ